MLRPQHMLNLNLHLQDPWVIQVQRKLRSTDTVPPRKAEEEETQRKREQRTETAQRKGCKGRVSISLSFSPSTRDARQTKPT